MLALALVHAIAVSFTADPVVARAQSTDCLTSTPAGRIARARLASGVEISIEGAFGAHVSGRRARVTVPALGLSATASIDQVEMQIVGTIEVRDGVFLTTGSRVHASSVDGARAIVGVLATDLSIESIEIPSTSLALAGASGTAHCAGGGAPAAWDTIERARASGTEHRLREALVLRARASGRAGPVHVIGGARVVRIEESGAWSRVVVDSDGTRAVGWVLSSALEPAPPREVGGSGGAMGSGRIGIGCLRGERDVRGATLATDTQLVERPGGRALGTLPAGTPLELGATRDRWIAVVATLGTRRIPRDCDGDPTGLAWIPLTAVRDPAPAAGGAPRPEAR